MLEHLAAGLLAFPALIRAALHMFVSREFLAFFTTLGASVRTGFTNCGREGAAPGHDLRGRRANVRTVLAGHQCGKMLFLVVLKHVCTVSGTHIALPLALRAF